jgi:pimeloyl-ACP methyl ester carboxylesterase
MTDPLSLPTRLARFALQGVDTPGGQVQYRQAGKPVAHTTHVLLHGIGSGSASWLMQLEAAAHSDSSSGVLAWEAPGYAASTPLPVAQPGAHDYAARLWHWLDALGLTAPITLVGHSLGALMAARAAAVQPERVARLVLLSPAQGYARAPAQEREKKLHDRLNTLATLGPQGMAEQRGAAMLSAQATATQVAFIQSVMAQIKPAGYTQAAHLLAQGDVGADLARWRGPLLIASGRADAITPMAACQALAAQCQVAWHDLGPVGHACALEAAHAVNRLLNLTQDSPA